MIRPAITTIILTAMIAVSGCSKRTSEQVDSNDANDAIIFRLMGPNGEPVKGAFIGTRASWVDYEARFGRPLFRGVFYGSRPARARATNENGKGTIAGKHLFPPNSPENKVLTMVALQEENELVGLVKVTREDLGKTIEVPMHSACRIKGRLVSKGLEELGQSLHWTNVYVYWSGSRPFSCSSEYRRFEFLLPPGQYEIKAYGTGTEEIRKRLQVLPGQRRMEMEIDLPIDIIAALKGKQAPEFEEIRQWKNGAPVKLSDLRNKVVLLHFWGFWCVPCLAEMPKLVQLHDKYADKGLVIIAVHDDSVESISELDNKLLKVKNTNWGGRNIPFLIALDGGGNKPVKGTNRSARGATTAAYGVHAFPTTVFIDKLGRVIDKFNVHSATDIHKLEVLLGLTKDSAEVATAGYELDTAIYILQKDEVLKHINPEQAQTQVRPHPKSSFAAFCWADGELVTEDAPMYERVTLKDALTSVIRLSKFEYECSQKLLSTNLNGDWIVRYDAPKRETMQALAHILSDELGLPIRITHQLEKKDVITARGRFKFQPLSGTHDDSQIHVYGDSLNLEGRGLHSGGNLQTFLDKVAERIVGKPIVNLSEPSEANEYLYVWLFHRPSTFIDALSPDQKSRKVRLILDNLSKHISLTFTEELRPVDVWYITNAED